MEENKTILNPTEYLESDIINENTVSNSSVKLNASDPSDILKNNIATSENIDVDSKSAILEGLESEEPEVKQAATESIPPEIKEKTETDYFASLSQSATLNYIRKIETSLKHNSQADFTQAMSLFNQRINAMEAAVNANPKKRYFGTVADNDMTRWWFGENAKYSSGTNMIIPSQSTNEKYALYNMELSPLVAAYNKGYYVDNGVMKPITSASDNERLVVEFDMQGEPFMVSKSWSDDPNSLMRTAFGVDDMYSDTLFSTIVRGSYAGMSKVLEAASWITSPFDVETSNRFANYAKYLYLQTEDEKESFFKRTVFNVSDGVFQMMPILIATPSMVGMFMKAGFSQAAAIRLAVASTSTFMGAEAGGAVMNQLIENGVPRDQAWMHSIIPFTAAIISENIFSSNILESAFVSGKISNKALSELVKETVSKTGTIKASSIAGNKILANNLKNKIGKQFDLFFKNPYLIPFAAGIEEASEEIFENVINTFAAPYQNARILTDAHDTYNVYKNAEYRPTGDGNYLKILRDGTSSVVGEKEMLSEQKDFENSIKIIRDPNLLETGINFEEAISAFFSSAIMGAFSIPTHLSARKNVKKQQAENTKFSMIARYYVESKNKASAEGVIRQNFRQVVNDGGLEHLNVDEHGNPATTKTQRTKADILEEQFIETVKLTATALETYGLTDKATIESFEGDTDIYSSLVDISSKMLIINNALGNLQDGKINPENIDGNVITEKSTVEDLKNELKSLQDSYNYYAVPEEGKKHSKAYNNKVHSIQIFNKLFDKELGDQIAKNMGYIDFNDETITAKKREDIKRKVEEIKPKRINTPGNIDIIKMKYQFDQATRSIFSFIDPAMMYEVMADTVYGENNKNSKIAQSILEQNNQEIKNKGALISEEQRSQKMAQFEASEKTVSQLLDDVGKNKDNITEAKNLLEVVTKEIDSMAQMFKAMNVTNQAGIGDFDIANINQRINEHMGRAKQVVSSLFGDQKYEDIMYEYEEGVTPDSLPVFEFFGNDITSGIMGQESGFIEGLGMVDTDNMTSEQVNKALDYYSNNAGDYLLYWSTDGNIHNFTQQAKELLERTEGDNVPNAKAEQLRAKTFADVFAMFDDFYMIEQEVMPSIENDNRYKESSPNYGKDRYRFSPEQLSKIRESIAPIKKALLDRSEKLKSVSSSKDFGQQKRKLTDLWMKYRQVEILSSMNETSDEVLKHITDHIDRVVAITENLSKKIGETVYDGKTEPMLYIWEHFAMQDNNSVERRAKIKEALIEIENSTYLLYDKLSGKIGANIKTFTAERFNKKNEFDSQGLLSLEFSKGIPLDYNSTSLEPETLLNPMKIAPDYKNLSYPSTPETQEAINDTYNVMILAEWDMINTQGKNGVPTIGSILSTLKDVQQTILDYNKNNEDGYTSFVPTYEQEQMIIQMIVNTMRKGRQSFIPNDVKHYIDKSIYLRGFAGTGKTSIVLDGYILAMSRLIDKKNLTIEIFSPSELLMNDHKEMRSDVLKFIPSDKTIDIKYKLFSEYASIVEPDILIFDEISSLGHNFTNLAEYTVIENLSKKLKDKNTHTVFMGDDSQVKNNAKQAETISEKRIAGVSAKIQPLAEIHRGKFIDINNLVNRFRLLGQNMIQVSNNASTDSFAFNETQGVEVVASRDVSINNALNFFKDNPQVVGDHKQASIIVFDDMEKRDVVELGKRNGLGDISKNIFIINALSTKTVDGKTEDVILEKDFMSGLGSEVVFITYDYEQALKDVDDSNMFNKENVRKNIYDRILTAASRAKSKVTIVSSKSHLKSVPAENVPMLSYESLDSDQYNIDLSENINRYDSVLDGLNIKKAEEVKTPDIVNIEKKQRLSYQTHDKHALKSAKKKTEDILKSEKTKAKNKPRISNLIFSNVQTNERSQENRQKNKIFRSFLELFVTPENKKNEKISEIKEQVDVLIDLVKKRNPETKLTAELYINKLIQSPPSTLSMIDTMDKFDIKTNVEMSLNLPKGEYSVSPFMIAIVGEVNGKPVIDIIDYVYKPQGTNVNPEQGTDRTMAYLVKAAMDNGFLVNNVIANVFVEDIDGSAMYGSETVYSPESIQKLLSQEGIEIVTGEAFISDKQYFEQSRLIPVSRELEVVTEGNKDVHVKGMVQTTDGLLYDIGTELITESEFTKRFTTKRDKWKRIDKFALSGNIFKNTNGALPGTSRFTVLSYQYNGQEVIVQDKDNLLSEMNGIDIIKEQIINKIKDKKIPVTQQLVKNVRYVDDNGQVKTDGYGIVNTISVQQMKVLFPKNNYEQFTVISFNNLPEMGYRKDGINQRINDDILKSFIEAKNEMEANKVMDSIKAMMSFNSLDSDITSEVSDVSVLKEEDQNNIDKNIATLELMRRLNNEDVTSELLHSGLHASRAEKSFDEFVSEMESRQFQVGSPETIGDGQDRKIAVEVKLNNHKVNVYLRSKRMVDTSQSNFGKQFKSDIKEFILELNNLKNQFQSELGAQTEKIDKTLFNSLMGERFKLLRESDAYNFLIYNAFQLQSLVSQDVLQNFINIKENGKLNVKDKMKQSTIVGNIKAIGQVLEMLQNLDLGLQENREIISTFVLPTFNNNSNMVTINGNVASPTTYLKPNENSGRTRRGNTTSQDDLNTKIKCI